MSDDVPTDVIAVFRGVFPKYAGVISRKLDATMVDGWDSVQHANLILALEEAFSCEVDLDAAFECANFGDLVDLLPKAIKS